MLFFSSLAQILLKSKICGREIDAAVKNGKRIIPIVAREIDWQDTPPKLGHLNYIFFSRDDDFDTAVKKLMTAIHTDYEWAATHRRLQVKALEWERNHKENSFLLRGKDLQEAELQLATNTSKEPHLTSLQHEYLFKSRQNATRQRRIITIISFAGIIGLVSIAIFGFVQVRLQLLQRMSQNEATMATIPAATVTMSDGSQTIELPEFEIEVNPVNNLAYDACVAAGKCTPPTGSADFVPNRNQVDPVVYITVAQAAIYCNWLGRTLPSTAQWDRARYIPNSMDIQHGAFIQ